jgi:acylglycerol lipase
VLDSAKQTIRLKTYRQSSKSKPQAIVIFFHGLGTHVNIAGHVAHYFAERSITTVGFDYRGFGKSQGNSGYIESLETHLQDSERFVELVKVVYPDTPIFASGLSLGGMTAYHLALRHPEWFAGALLLAPAIVPSMQHRTNIRLLKNVVGFLQYVMPTNLRVFPADLNELCRHSKSVDLIRNDKYSFQGRFKMRTISTLLEAETSGEPTFNQFKSPFMIVMGGRDKVIDPHVAF